MTMPSSPDSVNLPTSDTRLLQNPNRLKSLADNVLGVLYQFRLNPDGTMAFPYISGGAQALLGVAPEVIEQDAQVFLSLTHPEDRTRFEELVEESARSLTVWDWEGRLVLGTGEEKWIKAVSQPEQQPDGGILWDGWILDITASKQAEAALRASYERLESILAGSSEGFFALNSEWRFTHVNPIAGRLLGKEQGELLGKNIWQMFPEAVGSLFDDVYHEAMSLDGCDV